MARHVGRQYMAESGQWCATGAWIDRAAPGMQHKQQKGLIAIIERPIHESERASSERLYAQQSRSADYQVSIHGTMYILEVYATWIAEEEL